MTPRPFPPCRTAAVQPLDGLREYAGGAQSFAAEIWQGLLRNDPLSPVAGCKLWGLLRGGSAADFPAVLREAAGQGSVRPVAGGLAPSARGLVADVSRGAGG